MAIRRLFPRLRTASSTERTAEALAVIALLLVLPGNVQTQLWQS